ncbi:hypothetical protein [Methylophaga sp. OBS4]|uniref:hypothetical protein n=1 Tax=Methylophaga sp. OBS4 TaxID=2991935 RepID=UPI0022552F06|nr:hypothetical protein [Methylophaga sp. OBS4]MCX4187493.1 hypothetical protein [Methylophaga sp. OBS4]
MIDSVNETVLVSPESNTEVVDKLPPKEAMGEPLTSNDAEGELTSLVKGPGPVLSVSVLFTRQVTLNEYVLFSGAVMAEGLLVTELTSARAVVRAS